MSNSAQHYIGRNRPPRVHITYDVELGDAVRKYELKFLVGILSDLYGEKHELRKAKLDELIAARRQSMVAQQGLKPEEAARLVPDRELDDARSLKERKFIDIDKENFDQVLERILPCVKVSSESTLVFTKLEDFEPHRIVAQVKALSDLQAARDRLRDLSGALDGNDTLYAQVESIIGDLPEELREEFSKPSGGTPDSPDEQPVDPANPDNESE